MIYNVRNNPRIVGLHKHYVKSNARIFHVLTTGKAICHYANIHSCKYTPWFKASINSVAFLFLILVTAGVIFNPYSNKTPSEFYKIKLRLGPQFSQRELLQGYL